MRRGGKEKWTGTTETVTIGGQRIRVSIEGPTSSYPLVLISGIGAPLELWESFRRALGGRTVAFDVPGTGGSSTPLRPRTMWGFARTVSALLDRLGYQTVDVLGVSWGGGLAQHLALIRRSRVRRVVLAATAFGFGSVPGNLPAAAELLTPARYFSPSRLERVGPAVFGGEIRRRPEILREHGAVRSRHAPSSRGYVYQLLAAGTWASLPWLPLVAAETLVLLGDDDPIVHPVNGRILTRLLPNARLRVVPGAGHLFLIDQPEEAAAIVCEFLGAPGDARAPGRHRSASHQAAKGEETPR
jgi:poly(3-hydroxyalkanoate) depolymerase